MPAPSTAERLLQGLNPAQREAVCTTEGPLLILAGPGSGKTRVISHRIAYLLHQGVPDRAIAALTFTNKAADELAARVERLVPGHRVWTSTFHRFCAHLLRLHGERIGLPKPFAIYDADDARRVLKQVLEEFSGPLFQVTVQQVAWRISRAKNALVLPEEYHDDRTPLDRVVGELYPLYQQRLLECAALDFDDLLLWTVRLLRQEEQLRAGLDRGYRYLMVDEYQDTNLAQYQIVRLLSRQEPNLAVTGDPDQSIYGWRGADIRNILEFERDFPQARVVRLEQNYRSTKRILQAADCLIAHNRFRKPKRLRTDNPPGEPVRVFRLPDQQAEAEAVAQWVRSQVESGRRRYRDFAVFYRVNALSRTLEHALRQQGVPYQVVNGLEFYQRREVKDVLAYLALLWNPRDDVAFLRVVNTPPRGIGRRTLQVLQHAARQRRVPLLQAAREAQRLPELSARGRKALGGFAALMDRLSQYASQEVETIIRQVLQQTGYKDLYATESEEDQQRRSNIEELITAAREFDRVQGAGRLGQFLEQTALVNDTDRWQAEADYVSLMTLHAAKGLEFPAVWILAVEQGLLPHEFSRHEEEQLEEERRLLFVGMTRAKEQLCLSLVDRREFRGRTATAVPSQFLQELPLDEVEVWGHSADSWEAEPLSMQTLADVFHGRIGQQEAFPTHEPQEPQAPAPEAPETAAASGEGFARGESRRGLASGLPLATAAQLLQRQQGEAAAVLPERFAVGQMVLHPRYGLGRIVELEGQGQHRRATVDFGPGQGQRRFVLAQAPLVPLPGSGTAGR